MPEEFERLIKISSYAAAAVALLNCLFKRELSIEAISGYVGTGVSFGVFIGVLYERFLWRCDRLLNKAYVAGSYECRLTYAPQQDGSLESKDCTVEIKQSLLSLSIILKTDEMSSSSIIAQLKSEDSQNVIYYIYRTEPKALVRQQNPSQYGGARLLVESKTHIEGQYWTSQHTSGDMILNTDGDITPIRHKRQNISKRRATRHVRNHD